MEKSIHYSETIVSELKGKKIYEKFSECILKHIVTILISIFSAGRYYVFRYEGNLKGTENAVVLLTFPVALCIRQGHFALLPAPMQLYPMRKYWIFMCSAGKSKCFSVTLN